MCVGHTNLQSNRCNYNNQFKDLLIELQQLDNSSKVLDQSGCQMMASLLTYIGQLAGLHTPQGRTKSSAIQSSVSISFECEIMEYNSTPDFILTENFVDASIAQVVAMLRQLARGQAPKIIGLTLKQKLRCENVFGHM